MPNPDAPRLTLRLNYINQSIAMTVAPCREGIVFQAGHGAYRLTTDQAVSLANTLVDAAEYHDALEETTKGCRSVSGSGPQIHSLKESPNE